MKEKLRMIQWLALAGFFYALALTVFGAQPQLQTLAWKLGNVTVAAFVGYWIDRRAFRKPITPESSGLEQIRRAIVMAAAIIAVAMGL